MSTTKIANQTVTVWTETLSAGRVYVHDVGCPWVTTAAEWDAALAAVADDTFASAADAYQAVCDRIRPIATEGAAVDMRDADKDSAYGYTFSAWLAAAGRSDSASDYDLRAAWRAGEEPGEYAV